MQKPALVLVAALLFPAWSSQAASVEEIEAQRTACLDQANSNMEMKQCEGDALKAADLELNKVYQKFVADLKKPVPGNDDYLKRYNAEILKRLVAAQRAWIPYRDANCSLRATQMLQGSGEGLILIGCLTSTTLERIKELQDTLGTTN